MNEIEMITKTLQDAYKYVCKQEQSKETEDILVNLFKAEILVKNCTGSVFEFRLTERLLDVLNDWDLSCSDEPELKLEIARQQAKVVIFLATPAVSKSWLFCPNCGIEWEHDSNAFGCWQCGFISQERQRLLEFCQWIEDDQPIAFHNMGEFVDKYLSQK